MEKNNYPPLIYNLLVSRKLSSLVKTSKLRNIAICHEIKMHPTAFSLLVNRRLLVKDNDERVIKLAAFFNIPAGEAFEKIRLED